MTSEAIYRFRILVMPMVVAGLSSLTVTAYAQSEGVVALYSAQQQIDCLCSGVPNGASVHVVDAASFLYVQVTSSVADLQTTIQAPGGQIIDETSVASFGGEYAQFTGSGSGGPYFLPAGLPGTQYLYRLPSLGAGAYTIMYSAPGITQDEVVLTQVVTDSAVGANLMITENPLILGATSVVTAAVFDGDGPVAAASVDVTVLPPSGAHFALSLIDDGNDGDYAVGDGLYSAIFIPSEVGKYSLSGEITGTTAQGMPFFRHAGTGLTVVQPCAQLIPETATISAIDSNTDGLFEFLSVDTLVQVFAPGPFIMHATLTTPSGRTLRGYGYETLASGLRIIAASVHASDIVANGENGPFTLTSLELLCVTNEGAMPSGRLLNLTQNSPAYTILQFDRPRIQLTGVNMESTVDADCDGRSETLSVSIGISVVTPDTYYYQVQLGDAQLNEIQALGGETMLVGSSADAISLVFDGSLIASNGIDGPYALHTLVVYRTGTSLIHTTEIPTQAYSAQAFGTIGPFFDCNANSIHDRCDIDNGTSFDCQSDAIPDECQLDCNGNGIDDYCELADGKVGDCQPDGYPDSCQVDAGVNYPPDPMGAQIADWDCDCGGLSMRARAEQFMLRAAATPTGIVFRGAYQPNSSIVAPDRFTIKILADSSALPGTVLWSTVNPPVTRTATGGMLAGDDEYEYSINLSSAPLLNPGAYWLELYNDTSDTTGRWVWEHGFPDDERGLPGHAVSYMFPEMWQMDPTTVGDLTLHILTTGDDTFPPGGDGVPDSCQCQGESDCAADEDCSATTHQCVFVGFSCFSDLTCGGPAFNDQDACTCNRCVGSHCTFAPIRYGNVNCDPNQIINIDDILCILGAFGGGISQCISGDIHPPCTGSGVFASVNLDDILAVVGAFGGLDPCGCLP